MLLSTAFLCLLSIIGALAMPIAQDNNNYNEYLLPNNEIIPSNYLITIDVTNSFIAIPKEFTGEVKITAKATKDINKITLHAAFMNITHCDVSYVSSSNDNLYQSHTMDDKKQFLHLSVKQIVADRDFLITIGYKAKLHTDMHGFYVSSYLPNNNTQNPEYVLTTQFQPTHARKAFPCFDEPKYKATFEITIKKPAEYKSVISNMPGRNISDTEMTFTKTNKMSTYLVAFIVSKFEYVESIPNFKVWSRPAAINQTIVAKDAAKPLVDILNNFTGINYDNYVKKLDMAALPDFSAGAMENWGLLTYRETALLFDDNLSTNRDLQRIVTVIAHELGHQWFGNLVTTAWWDNTWLNEGFARYIEYNITGKYKPDWQMHLQFVIDQLQSVFEVDSLKETTPLNRAVYTPEQISSHFGSISYSKGGSVIRMMEHFLGTDIFEAGLQNYLQKRNLSSTVPGDLWADIDFVASLNLEYSVNKIMNPWINQPGYPLVTVTVDGGKVTFDQQRFFLKTPDNYSLTEKWFIPISYTTSAEKNFVSTKPKLWLTPQEPKKIIELNASDWLIANIQETGYYRVNYNDAHWMKLKDVLISNKDHIDRMNRAQIIDDVMNLARAGIVDYKIAFDITDYLSKETDYYPWSSAFRAFTFLLQRYSETDGAGEQLRIYIKNRMKTLLNEKSLIELKATNHTDIFNVVNALQWACNLDEKQCVDDSKELFKGNASKIDKNFKSIVYCTAIRQGTEDDWNKLKNQYVNSNVAAEKVAIINALGCSNKKEILDSYLKMSIDDKIIRSQDASYVFSAVYTSGPEGVKSALNFLKNYSTDIVAKYGGMNALDNAALGLASRLTEKKQIDELTSILNDPVFDNIRKPAIETTKQNEVWANEYSTSIESILKEKNSAIRSIFNYFTMYLSLAFITIYYKSH